MEAEQYNKVKEMISRLSHTESEIEQAYYDRIIVQVAAYPELFPNKFIEVLNAHDGKQYPDSGFRQVRLFRRLDAILSAFEELPDERRRGSLLEAEMGDDLIPTFTLSKSDLDRVLELCGQMRKIVLAATQFDEPHKVRLLNRIAGIEKQALNKKGLLDVVRAGVSDVGETLGKFGTDIKPLTDRMKEVASIARRSSKQYDQLPEPEEIQKLPKPEDFDKNSLQ